MTIDLTTFEPARASLVCGASTHWISWSGGELSAEDHGDADGEMALAALGGSSVRCLDVLGAWRRHRRDPALLTVLTRGAGDFLRREEGPPMAVGRRRGQLLATRPAGRGGYVARAGTTFLVGGAARPAPRSSRGQDDGLGVLAQLGGSLPRRLVSSVTAALLDDPLLPARAGLEASLFGRFRNSLVTWLGDPHLDLRLEAGDPDDEVVIDETDGGGVAARVPLSWVADVWGRGLDVVAEGLGLVVAAVEPSGLWVETLADDLRTRRHVRIDIGGGAAGGAGS